MGKQTLGKNIIKLAFLTIGLKIVGFVSRLIIAYYFGTTLNTDIYYSAVGFIDAISAIILSGFTVGIVKMYIEKKEKRDEFLSNLFCFVSVVSLSMIVLCVLFANPISNILLPQKPKDNQRELSHVLRIMCLAFPFQGAITILSGILQAEKKFVPIKITGTITSIVNIVMVVVLSNRLEIHSLVLAYVVGAVLNSIFLFFNIRNNVKISFKKIAFNEDIKKIINLIIPLTIGMAVHQVNLIIDRSVASTVAIGAISALSYSSFIYLFIENVIIQNVSTAVFPEIVEAFQNGDSETVITRKIRLTIMITIYTLIPIVFICFLNDNSIVALLYKRGSFNDNSLILTSAALRGYVLGLPFLAVRDICYRVYYAYGDTKTPVTIGIFAVIVNIVLDFVLSRIWGIFGITIATSISNAISAFFAVLVLRKHNDYIIKKEVCFECTFLLLLCGASIILLKNVLESSWTGLLSESIIIVLVEILIAFVFKTYTYRETVTYLKDRRKR